MTTPDEALRMLDELVPPHLRSTRHGEGFMGDRYTAIKEVLSNAADYEMVVRNHRQLVRELDVLLNGESGAAKWPALVDILGQLRARREVAIELAEKLNNLGVTRKEWSKDAHHFFSHTSGRVHMSEVESFFDRAVNLAERTATFLLHGVPR